MTAIRGNLQSQAAAITHHYGQLGHAPRPVFDLLLKYAISEDGALHAEKYYRTVSEEFAATRPGVPLAPADGPGPRHRQRIRPPGRRLRRGPRIAGDQGRRLIVLSRRRLRARKTRDATVRVPGFLVE